MSTIFDDDVLKGMLRFYSSSLDKPVLKVVTESYLKGYEQAMYDSIKCPEQGLYLPVYGRVQKQLKENLEGLKERLKDV